MRNQHDCDVIIVMLLERSLKTEYLFQSKKESYNMAKTIIRLYTQV